jgi:D-psicose/D-tagatose/L-ribulose 3-epimerase
MGSAAEGLRAIGDYASSAGVRFGVEVLNRYEANLFNTAQGAREVVDLAGHPNAGILLDTFHMNIEEADPGEAIRAAGDRLVHLQASDNHRGAPGDGAFRWREAASALKEIGYKWDVAIECFNMESRMGPLVHLWRPLAESPDAQARRGMAFLKDTLRA